MGYKVVTANAPVQPEENLNAASQDSPVHLPIIMYHSLLKDPNRAGDFIISPTQLESDLKALKEAGYTSVFVEDLVRYVNDGIPLPDKPIMITFDDGYYNNYYYGFPLFKEYQTKAIISPIAYQSEKFSTTPDPNPNYAHLTWQDLKEMTDSGLVEIQNHSYNFHATSPRKGARIKSNESFSEYEKILSKDTNKAQQLFIDNINYTPIAYTYPFGAYCKESEKILKSMGFKVTFITCDKPNFITKDPECLYKLNRYIRPANISTQELLNRIELKDK